MKKLLFIFLITLAFQLNSLAQKQGRELIDSLLTQVQQAKEDSNKINLYISLLSSHQYYRTEDGVQYEKPALELAQKLNLSKFIYRIKYHSGRLYWRLGDYDNAMLNHFEALKLAENEADRATINRILIALGQSYVDQKMYKEALDYFNQALLVAQELNNKRALAIGYSFLWYTYSSMGMGPESLHYKYEELNVLEQLGDSLSMAKCRLQISLYFESIGNDSLALALKNKAIEELLSLLKKSNDRYDRINFNNIIAERFLAENKFQEALQHLELAYKIAEEYNDIGELGNARYNIGNVYEQMGETTIAIENYLLAAANNEKILLNQNAALIYIKIGQCYTSLKKYNEARIFFDKALDFAIIQGNETVATEYYGQVELLDSATGDWKNAYLNYKLFVRNTDQRNKELNSAKSARVSMQFAYDREQAIAKAEQEQIAIRRRDIRNSTTAGIAGVIILIIVIFHQRYRLQQARQLLQLRNRIAGDLHDEIGSTLSSISLYGEVVKKLVKDDSDASGFITKINDSTTNMMEAISDIVWTINTNNDTLDEVISKIRTYAVQRMEALGCKVHFNELPPVINMKPDMIQRKNIYLLAKEAVNNAAKYSYCKNLHVEFNYDKKGMVLKIRDDGKGFNLKQVKRGNGLVNMEQRALDVKGTLLILSTPGNGTEVSLTIY